MKLKNKKTGEIATLTLSSNGEELLLMKNNEMATRNVKLSDLEGWEDVPEEPEMYWYINPEGEIGNISIEADGTDGVNANKAIGNYFETKEEAEKAVEKLKAWKRLKDKGFRFTGWNGTMTGRGIEYKAGKYYEKWIDDMNLIFGGEE